MFWWKNTLKFMYRSSYESITYKDIGGFKNIFGFPGRATAYIKFLVDDLI